MRGARLEVVAKVNVVENSTIFGHTLAGMWLLVLVPVFLSVTTDERHLVDFLSYRRAAEALVRGDSPYAPPEQARATWLAFYQLEADSTETPTRAPTAANCIRTDSDSATTACFVTL